MAVVMGVGGSSELIPARTEKVGCSSPEFASHGVCATVMPSSDHTTTSARSAMVPKNLRVRMVMTEMCGSHSGRAPCAREGADYKVRANSFKRSFDDPYFGTPRTRNPRHPLVARLDRRPDCDHGAGRRRHPSHRVRAVDRRVETGHPRPPPAQSTPITPTFRGLQDHSTISRTQRRHESW